MVKVFLSSVSRSLSEVRATILAHLRTARYDVISMETFGADPEIPLEVCLREIRTADVVVLVIGPTYGTIHPGLGVSYTHEEFREARRRGIPVIAFRIPDQEGIGGTERERLNQFCEEVGGKTTYMLCKTEDLSGAIQASLRSQITEGRILPIFQVFQPFNRYFSRQLNQNRGATPWFNHLTPFVGRKDELSKITAFLSSDDPLFMLIAPGGAGKSRLLLEVASAVSDLSTPLVLFVEPSLEWTSNDIARLPTTPLVLVVDDAHRRTDLERLFIACSKQNRNVRFIVSCRPSAKELVERQVGHLLVQDRQLPRILLAPMARPDAFELARVSLGEEYEEFADRLVRAAGTNPLVITVAARWINQRQIPPETLGFGTEEFRIVVLDKLLDDPALIGDTNGLRRSMLELISAIGPLPIESEDILQSMSTFLGTPLASIQMELSGLELAGLVQRRGRLVRVVPDVLADHLLFSRALTRGGANSGYIDSVLKAFPSNVTENILANASELDWRISEGTDREKVLTNTWRAISQGLPDATEFQRIALLEQIKRAAAFAPGEVLEIIEWLCEHPCAPEDPEMIALGARDLGYRVKDALCDSLSFIAGHPDYTSRCLVHLWAFATHDNRETSPRPSHPRRRLQDLLKYDHEQLSLQEKTLEFLISKLDREPRNEEYNWAVDLLGTVLSREGVFTSSTRRAVTFCPYSLVPLLETIQPRRKAVLDCLTKIGLGQRVSEAASSIKLLGSLLHPPIGLYNRVVEQSEVEAWLPEGKEAVARLVEIGRSAPLPIIRFLAGRELRSVNHEHWLSLRAAVENAIKSIPASSADGLFNILLGRPWKERHRDWQQEEERVREECEAAARYFWETSGGTREVIGALLASIRELRSVIGRNLTNDGALIWALVSVNPDSAREVLSSLASNEEDHSVGFIPRALAGLRNARGIPYALELLREFSGATSSKVRANLVRSLWSILDPETVSNEELNYFNTFISDPEPAVRRASIRPLSVFSKNAPREAISTLLTISWEGDPGIAEEACAVLNHSAPGGLGRELLSDSEVLELLNRIKFLSSIDDYEILEFIAWAFSRMPINTCDMLINRIRLDAEYYESGSRPPGTPIPYNGQGMHFIRTGIDASVYQEVITKVRDASLEIGNRGYFWIPELFRVIVGDFDSARQSLREWVDSHDSEKIFTVARLMRGFDHSLIFSEHEFISNLIEKSVLCGSECRRRTEGELFGAAISGVFSGTPGEPAPRHLSDKENAIRMRELYRGKPETMEFYNSLVRHADESIRRDVSDFDDEEA